MYANNVALPTSAHQAATAAATDRYLLPAGPTAAVCGSWMGQTDRQTDARQMHRPCSTYYAEQQAAHYAMQMKKCKEVLLHITIITFHQLLETSSERIIIPQIIRPAESRLGRSASQVGFRWAV